MHTCQRISPHDVRSRHVQQRAAAVQQQWDAPAVAAAGQVHEAAPPPCHVGKRELGAPTGPLVRPVRRLVGL